MFPRRGVFPDDEKKRLNGTTFADVFRILFEGNLAVENSVTVKLLDITYVIFAKKVVQYYDDSLDSAYGVKSTLYEDLARAVFQDVKGVYFCTDIQGGDDVIIGGKMI